MTSPRRHRRQVFADPRSAVSLLAMGVFVVMLVGTSKSPSPPPPSPGVTFSTGGGGGGMASSGGAPGSKGSGARGPDAGAASPKLLSGPLAEALPIGRGKLDALRFRHEDALGVPEVEAQYVAALVSRGYAVTTRKDDPKRRGGRTVQLTRGTERVVLRLGREATDVVVSLRVQHAGATAN